MNFRASLALLVAALVSPMGWAGEQELPRYTVIQIPDSTATYPRDINNRQVVAGFLYLAPRFPETPEESSSLAGFVQHQRLVLPIASLYNDHMIGNGINDRGDITGIAFSAGGVTAYLLSRGELNRIDVPGSYVTNPQDLNNKGDLVGFYQTNELQARAFVLRKGNYITLDPLKGQQGDSRAFGINNKGHVVGDSQTNEGMPGLRRGFLFRDGTYTPIEVPGAHGTGASSINDAGVIVGTYSPDGFTTDGFIYWKGRFATVHIPGSSSTEVNAINDKGYIVGTFSNDEELLGFRSHFSEFWR